MLALVTTCTSTTTSDMFELNETVDSCASDPILQLNSIPGNSETQRLFCAIQCLGMSAQCRSFSVVDGQCRLSGSVFVVASGADGTASGHYTRRSVLSSVPSTYSVCNDTAYRVLPWHGRPEAVAACAADGGIMALPFTSQQRSFVSQLIHQAAATPGFNSQRPVDNPHFAYVGVVLHSMSETVTAGDGVPVTVPANAWVPGEPNDHRAMAWTVLDANEQGLRDWHSWGYLMSVCQKTI